MRVSRLREIPGIGVDRVGELADTANDPEILRLENLDTDIRPPEVALAATRHAVDDDAANSYLPFAGHRDLRRAATAHVARLAGVDYDWGSQCVVTTGGLSGLTNVLLALLEPGDEVVVCDPIYAGMVNRIRLAGGVPRFVSLRPTSEGWTLDPEELAAAIGPRTRALLAMSPSMPTGAIMDERHWEAVMEPLARRDAWLIHNAAMERILFDGRSPAHPAAHRGLAERTITIGSASKELRMIGWRVGWVVGPREVIADVALVGLTNVVVPVGIGQAAVAAALTAPAADADIASVNAELERRRNTLLGELDGLPVVPPHGGWSMLLDTHALGMPPATASERLLARAKVAATPMNGWGPAGERYLRFVFANEPVERLAGLGARVRSALG